MALPVFTLFAILSVADAARIRTGTFAKTSTSGKCTPIMANWICQKALEKSLDVPCAEELCNSPQMANYNGKGPHPKRDDCCSTAGEAIPGAATSEPEPAEALAAATVETAEPVAVATVEEVAPAEVVEAVEESTEPAGLQAPVPDVHALSFLPSEEKVLEKVFIATEREPKMSWGMTCISLCEAENVDQVFDFGCQPIQSLEDCKRAQEESDFEKFYTPTNARGQLLWKQFPAGCLWPEGKDYVLWNPPSPERPLLLNNICGRYVHA